MKAIIVEDIMYELELIKSLLAQFFPTIEIVSIANNVQDAVHLISTQKPDLLLMDIEIMGGTSYDVLNILQSNNQLIDFEIIFITGNRRFDYATMAFSYSALDFLTKPIDNEQFKQAVSKAIERNKPLQNLQQIQLFMDFIRSAEHTQSKMAIHKIGGEIEFIEINQILYLEADREITNFHFKNGTIIKTNKNLGFYDQLLVNNHRFFSISNSILINLEELKSYDHSEKRITLSTGINVYTSRRGGQDLRNYISKKNETNKNEAGLMSILKRIFRS